MIKLIVIARCIPEDVYLRSLEQPAPVLVGEKKFSIVVRDPEEWYIGRLAIVIKDRYESLYKRQFGQIKYLKDGEDDCDLDPELSVVDLLVDEGKAARDGADQKRVVKVIQEQGRAIRQGSVVPDLTPIHYQPPTRPPVPKFPVAEKRTNDQLDVEERSSKRRRLGQIEEEGEGEDEGIINSIEGNAINGNLDDLSLQPKQESPEIARTWVSTRPATRDELEELPEPPTNWQQRQARQGMSTSNPRHTERLEISETSAAPHEQAINHRTPSVSRDRAQPLGSADRQQSQANVETLISAGVTSNNLRTPGSHAVRLLNGMTSASSAPRQSESNSARRLQKAKKNIYDVEESDIDDSQMSPRSRASRAKITPRLVKVVHKGSCARSPSSRPSAGDAMSVDSNKENHKGTSNEPNLPQTQRRASASVSTSAKDKERPDWSRDGISKLQTQSRVPAKRPRNDSCSAPADHESALASDETWSLHSDGTRSKKKKKISRSARADRRSETTFSKSKSSSIASSTRESASTNKSSRQGKTKKGIAPTRIGNIQNQDLDEEMDSPSAQLEQSLRQSSPIKPTTQVSATNARRSHSISWGRKRPALDEREEDGDESEEDDEIEEDENEEEEDVERPPESVSEAEEFAPPLRTPKKPKTKAKIIGSEDTGRRSMVPTNGTRCYTCWTKLYRCDNTEPKCHYCQQNKRNCQYYSMTRDEFEQEKSDRKAGRTKAPKTSKHMREPLGTIPSTAEAVVTVSARDDESEEEDETRTAEEEEVKERDRQESAHQPRTKRKKGRKLNDPKQTTNGFSVDEPKASSYSDEVEQAAREEQPLTATKFKQKKLKPKPSEQIALQSETDAKAGNEEPRSSQMAQTPLQEPATSTKSNSPKKEKQKISKQSPKPSEIDVEDEDKTPDEAAEVKAPVERKRASSAIRTEQNKDRSSQSPQTSEVSSVNTTGSKQQSVSADQVTTPTPNQATNEMPIVDTHLAPPDTEAGRQRSTERHSVIPDGMTKEQYELAIRDRGNLTEEQRRKHNSLARKLAQRKEKDKESTPLVPRSQKSESLADRSRKRTPSLKSDNSSKVPASSQFNEKIPQTQQLPATQPDRIPASVTSSTPITAPPVPPKSAPAKPRSATPTTSKDQTRITKTANGRKKLQVHPTVATTASATDNTKHQNPPFKPLQPQRKTLLAHNATTATKSSSGTPKSLNDLRRDLVARSRAGSATSTPKSGNAATKKTPAVQLGFHGTVDDEESGSNSTASDSDSESDSPSHTSDEPNTVSKKPKFSDKVVDDAARLVNGQGRGASIVKKREVTPDQSGSGSGTDSSDEGN